MPITCRSSTKETWNYAVRIPRRGSCRRWTEPCWSARANCSDMYREAQAKINRSGVSGMLIKKPSSILRLTPLMDVISDLALEMKGDEVEMGFTPASSSRISMPADTTRDDKP